MLQRKNNEELQNNITSSKLSQEKLINFTYNTSTQILNRFVADSKSYVGSTAVSRLVKASLLHLSRRVAQTENMIISIR